MAAAFTTCPPPRGDRVAVVTTSGGAGAWAADALARAGLALPELSPPLQQAIAGFIPAYGSARNPVDITAQAVHTGGLLRAIELLRESPEIDAIVAVVSLASETRMTIDIDALKTIVEQQAKPILFWSYSALARKMLASAGLPIHTGLATLAAAVSALTQGVLLEPMARPGVEVILGAIRDKVFGPLVMVGAGGIMTELLRDAAYRLVPVERAEAKEMLQGLRIAKLLRGFRGAPPADLDALAALVAQLSAFAFEHRDLVEEIELNPVIVHQAGEGCTVVDALLTLETG